MNSSNDEKNIVQITKQPPTASMGIFGALAGAAIGSIAAVYLSDEKNRDTLSKQIVLFRDRIIKVMDTFAEQEKKSEQINSKLDDIQESVHTI